MNNIRAITKLSEAELKLGATTASWHDEYKHSSIIFVGGYPYELTEGDIICVFSQYGEILDLHFLRDKSTGQSKGYCFIKYEDQRSTILAVDNLNGIQLLHRTIRVDHLHQYKRPDVTSIPSELQKYHETYGGNVAPEVWNKSLEELNALHSHSSPSSSPSPSLSSSSFSNSPSQARQTEAWHKRRKSMTSTKDEEKDIKKLKSEKRYKQSHSHEKKKQKEKREKNKSEDTKIKEGKELKRKYKDQDYIIKDSNSKKKDSENHYRKYHHHSHISDVVRRSEGERERDKDRDRETNVEKERENRKH